MAKAEEEGQATYHNNVVSQRSFTSDELRIKREA